MAGKGIVFFAAALAAWFLAAAVLPAQEGDYFIAREKGSLRFVQRLSWGHDELVYRYEVILEKEREEGYAEILSESTEESHLSVSLSPGRYRYAVGVYNLLDKLEYTMDWVYFEVLRALRPEIRSFSPEEFFKDDSDAPLLLALRGQDIAENADIMLRPLGRPVREIRPLKRETEDDRILLTFDGGQLEPGDYELYVRNPGGLDDSRGTLGVRMREKPKQLVVEQPVPEQPVAEQPAPEQSVPKQPAPEQESRKTVQAPSVRPDIGVSADYAPLLYLYGSLFAPDVFEDALFPLGAAGRLHALPLERNWGSLGAELSASWHRLEEQKDAYTVSAQLMEARLSLLYQYRLPNRIMALNFRIGAGMLLLKDFRFDYGNGGAALDSSYLTPSAGLSFQWRVAGRFFVEAGAIFAHILSADDSAQPGYLQPMLGAGWIW
ncbi:MAG: porin family protein [Treponema sp.]|jgi:hypothetical protein|nr:porin family protein [Treponema sp.]